MLLCPSQSSFQMDSILRQRGGGGVISASGSIRNQDVKEIHLQNINPSLTCNRKSDDWCNLGDNPV